MTSTHLSLHYHIVFSTKDREPWLAPNCRSRVHEYLGGILRNLSGVPHAVGGTGDHVHVLTGLTATYRLADVMRELKSDSSAWITANYHCWVSLGRKVMADSQLARQILIECAHTFYDKKSIIEQGRSKRNTSLCCSAA